MRGILFVVDCLRTNVFPEWFLAKYKGSFFLNFLSCINTILSLNSILTGKHFVGSSDIPVRDDESNLLIRPKKRTIPEILRERGVTTFFYTDESLIKNGWWRDVVQMIENISEVTSFDSFLLMWHTYKTHSPHGEFTHNFAGSYMERKRCKEEYLKEVETAFQNIDFIIKELNPDHFIVMGDHGEEFWVDNYEGDTQIRETGHGKFGAPILTNNTVFVPLLIKDEKSGVFKEYVSYTFLGKTIMNWYL